MSQPENAAALIEYLAERGQLRSASGLRPRLTALAGGVSAETVLVEAGTERLVLKRALGRLLVAGEWHAKPERAMTEAAAISALHAITPAHVPRLRHADSRRNTLVMEAAPADWVNWKTVLMGEAPDPSAGITATAAALGRVLGSWHSRTWRDPAIAARFADEEAFEQLRIGPFYRVVAARHASVAARVADCVAQLETTRDCLVHGDYSPKNVLVGPDGLMVLDFEVAHTGAAVFDVAFMQSHLVLKALHRPGSAAALAAAAAAFLTAYETATDGMTGTDTGNGTGAGGLLGAHVACLLLARVDGLSPAPYLTPATAGVVRELALALLAEPGPAIVGIWQRVTEAAA
jgi:aminoglycoside phosphotransferase (APT) family kinase protein